jgi:hypothetical protein
VLKHFCYQFTKHNKGRQTLRKKKERLIGRYTYTNSPELEAKRKKETNVKGNYDIVSW